MHARVDSPSERLHRPHGLHHFQQAVISSIVIHGLAWSQVGYQPSHTGQACKRWQQWMKKRAEQCLATGSDSRCCAQVTSHCSRCCHCDALRHAFNGPLSGDAVWKAGKIWITLCGHMENRAEESAQAANVSDRSEQEVIGMGNRDTATVHAQTGQQINRRGSTEVSG